ncbi:chemotaxis protein, partial [Thioclava sp. BHET1]
RGVDLVGKTGEALKEIVTSVSGIAVLVSEIAASANQQSTGLAEINSAVNDLDQSTQQNAARLEETTAASQSLTNDATSMVESVSHFRLGQPERTEKIVSFRARRGEDASRSESASSPRNLAVAAAATRPRESVSDQGGWEDF